MQANAVATFNILTQEGRHVVAGLLPLRSSESGAAATAPLPKQLDAS